MTNTMELLSLDVDFNLVNHACGRKGNQSAKTVLSGAVLTEPSSQEKSSCVRMAPPLKYAIGPTMG